MNDFSKWTDQVALISDAGSEFSTGSVITRRLAREDVHLPITVSSERIRQRVGKLSACDHGAHAVSANPTDKTQVQSLPDWVKTQWG